MKELVIDENSSAKESLEISTSILKSRVIITVIKEYWIKPWAAAWIWRAVSQPNPFRHTLVLLTVNFLFIYLFQVGSLERF